jgi:hypothetical protein
VRRKAGRGVDRAKLHGECQVEQALQVCAQAGRFGEGDLAKILAHQQTATDGEATVVRLPVRSPEAQTLQRPTSRWAGFGR